MGAQASAQIVMPAFTKQMQIDIAEQQRERIRILRFARRLPGIDPQKVGPDTVTQHALEQAGGVDGLEFAQRVASGPGNHRDAPRIGLKGAHHRPSGCGVRT